MSESNFNTELKKEKTYQKILNIHNIPALSSLITEMNRLIHDPNTSAYQLGELLGKDQGLVSKILTVANSPLYGIPRRVSTIEFAIVILGFNHIKNIAIAFTIMDSFNHFQSKNFNFKEYWIHCLLVATASKKISSDLGYPLIGEAFTSGLLHDLGILVISKYFPKEFNEINELIEIKGMNNLEAEKNILGYTHQEIGQILIDRWNLPPELSEAVRFHHNPGKALMNKHLSSIVHIADYLTTYLKIGNISYDVQSKLDLEVINILKLGDENYLYDYMKTYETLIQEQVENIALW